MNVRELGVEALQKDSASGITDVLTFITARWGLNTALYPTQRFILKLYYGLDLNKQRKTIEVPDTFGENVLYTFTETEFLHYLFDEGMCNIGEPDHVRSELVLSIGRRGTKTTMTAMMAAYELYRLLKIENPQEYYEKLPDAEIGVSNIAASQDQAKKFYNVLSSFLKRCAFFQPYIIKNNSTQAELRTPADNEIYPDDPKKGTLFVSNLPCSARSSRGGDIIFIILDEFAHFVQDTTGPQADEKIYEALVPSASTFRDDGKVVSISSPASETGKFYELFTNAFDEEKGEDMLAIRMPSRQVNPTISTKRLKKWFRTNPTTFRSEYGGEFVRAGGKWLEKEEYADQCVDHGLRERRRGMFGIQYFLGTDLAIRNDGSAFVVTHREDGQNGDAPIIVVDLAFVIYAGVGDYEDVEELPKEDIIRHIQEICNKFRIRRGVLDTWGGLLIKQDLESLGIDQIEVLNVTDSLNSQIYQTTKNHMVERTLRMYPHEELTDELKSLVQTIRRKYVIKVEAPNKEGCHDDLSDAYARAVWLASTDMAGKKRPSVGGRRGRAGKSRYSQMRAKRVRGGGDERRNPRAKGRRMFR